MPPEVDVKSSDSNAGRLIEFLDRLKKQGISQREVAGRAKVSVQYLSDVKGGGRNFTELFARRLTEEFGGDYRWLLGQSDSMEPPRLNVEKTTGDFERTMLPVFARPIEGDPQTHRGWDGTTIEVVGAAAARSRNATHPYVLRIVGEDRRGRLRQSDLVLVSQALDADAEIQVVKTTGKAILARAVSTKEWEPLTPKKIGVGGVEPIGHIIGIVWGVNA